MPYYIHATYIHTHTHTYIHTYIHIPVHTAIPLMPQKQIGSIVSGPVRL